MKKNIDKSQSQKMKNGVAIGGIILLLGVMILFSGCVGQDNTKSAAPASPPTLVTKTPPPPLNVPGYVTPTATAPKTVTTTAPKAKTTTNPQTTTAAPVSSAPTGLEELLIKQPDVPGLALKDFGFQVAGSTGNTYNNALPPAGAQAFGQYSSWSDGAKNSLYVFISKGDVTGTFDETLAGGIQNCELSKKKGETIDCGTANLGDLSYYSVSPPTASTGLSFKKNDVRVTMKVTADDKEKSKAEAFRIGKLIESRLK